LWGATRTARPGTATVTIGFGQGLGYRIYRSRIGPFNTIVHEIEFEDIAAREAFWDKWWETRATPEFMEKWSQLVVEGGGVEIWTLE
jgi:hypothetical protein